MSTVASYHPSEALAQMVADSKTEGAEERAEAAIRAAGFTRGAAHPMHGTTTFEHGAKVPQRLVDAAADAGRRMQRKIDAAENEDDAGDSDGDTSDGDGDGDVDDAATARTGRTGRTGRTALTARTRESVLSASAARKKTGNAPGIAGPNTDSVYSMSASMMRSIKESDDMVKRTNENAEEGPPPSSRGLSYGDFLHKKVPAGIRRFPLAVINLANERMSTRCTTPLFRILFMASTEEQALTAEAMIVSWPRTADPITGEKVDPAKLPKADRMPMSLPFIVPTCKLVACMRSMAEQNSREAVSAHVDALFDAWDDFQAARSELRLMNKRGTVPPKACRRIFDHFVLTDGWQDAYDRRREERSELKASGDAKDWTDRDQKEDDADMEARTQKKGRAPMVSSTPRPRTEEKTMRKVSASTGKLARQLAGAGSLVADSAPPLPDLDPDSVEARKTSMAARAFPRLLRRMLSKLYPSGSPERNMVDPLIPLSIMPDSSTHPCFETEEWKSGAEIFGEARKKAWQAPARIFDDNTRRPFVRLYPFMVPSVSVDAVKHIVEDVVRDMQVIPVPLGEWRSLVRIRVDGADIDKRDEAGQSLVSASRNSRARVNAYTSKCLEMGVDMRGEVIGQSRMPEIAALKEGGWQGPTSGSSIMMAHHLRSKVDDANDRIAVPPMPSALARDRVDPVTGRVHMENVIHPTVKQVIREERRRRGRNRGGKEAAKARRKAAVRARFGDAASKEGGSAASASATVPATPGDGEEERLQRQQRALEAKETLRMIEQMSSGAGGR